MNRGTTGSDLALGVLIALAPLVVLVAIMSQVSLASNDYSTYMRWILASALVMAGVVAVAFRWGGRTRWRRGLAVMELGILGLVVLDAVNRLM